MNDIVKFLPASNVASFSRNSFGERLNGDIALYDQKGDWSFLAIVDGLGHGFEANKAAEKAKTFLLANWNSNVIKTIKELHETLQDTVGAAAGLASIDNKNNRLHYSAIGNTVFRIIGENPIRLMPSDGILGKNIRSPGEQTISLKGNEIILMYSDGVSDNFDLNDYPLLKVHSPIVAAKTIVRKFGNNYDDATCLVMRYKEII